MLGGLELQSPDILSFAGMESVVFYFTIYSFLGWIIENCYSFLTKRIFFKPNFFIGPLKPMYGFAPVLLIFMIRPNIHWVFILIFCLVVPTLVEYISGYLLERFFHRQWWDYSGIPMQLHGHICLPFSICWFVLSIFCLQYIHPLIVSIYESLETVWVWLCPVVLAYLLLELYLAVRRHSYLDVTVMKSTDSI
ncbi:putative ABC transporter permease [Bacillus massilinigeriensis]|uniref:putative ABC transporter permease n=1 Tax=Bacillus massilionigeriensis TaxID=1805475 RepID=UPI00096ADB64|nr:putative ABC transporter permease [Bacillus massilionigeriensis]